MGLGPTTANNSGWTNIEFDSTTGPSAVLACHDHRHSARNAGRHGLPLRARTMSGPRADVALRDGGRLPAD
jgi:hypothetical protein